MSRKLPMKAWYVVQTQPLKETVAHENLETQGYTSYLPMFLKTRRHARKTEMVKVPLFPRYLFVQFDIETQRWREINGTRGVVGLLMNNQMPAMLPEEVIHTLKAQESENGVLTDRVLALFSVKDSVRVLDGPFAGHEGTIAGFTDQQRVEILLNFLGREIKVAMQSTILERV